VEWSKMPMGKIRMESTRKNKGRMVSLKKITRRFMRRNKNMNT
jgi:hypothetical protein